LGGREENTEKYREQATGLVKKLGVRGQPERMTIAKKALGGKFCGGGRGGGGQGCKLKYLFLNENWGKEQGSWGEVVRGVER